jgi:hypothetical protein
MAVLASVDPAAVLAVVSTAAAAVVPLQTQAVQALVDALPSPEALTILTFAPLVFAAGVVALFRLQATGQWSLVRALVGVVAPAGLALYALFTTPAVGRLALRALSLVVALIVVYAAASAVYYLSRIRV